MTEFIFIAILIFFTFVLILVWRKAFLLQKELKKEVKELREALDTSYDKLLKNIEKEIEFLDGQPGLSEEEKKLRDKLFEAIQNSKKIIEKEIEDVEKKTK